MKSFIKPLVKDLKQYKRIESIGNGNTALSAKQLVYSMYSEDKFIIPVDTSIKINYLANSINKNDLLIVFSITGSTNTYKKLFQQRIKRKLKLI
ncbi:hypothetical protein SDC49_05570 [Lactobacillus sp. R2/2]|nr:hypothetical protein [Lactobacillus sp. R2/2]